jgi:hypothetical protein
MKTLYAEVEVLKMQVAELKCLSLMQNALIGQLCAEIAAAGEGARDTHAVLGGVMASLGGVVDHIGADRPGPASVAFGQVLSRPSNDVGEAEGKAIWRLMRLRA